MLRLKQEMKEIYGKMQSDTDLKFKKLVVLDNQLTQLKQEQDVLRVKRTKENSQQNQDLTKLIGRLVKTEKDLVDLRQGIQALSQDQISKMSKVNKDLEYLKGPFMTEYTNIKRENEAIFRELERSQLETREMLLCDSTLDQKETIGTIDKSIEKSHYRNQVETSRTLLGRHKRAATATSFR